MIFIIITETPIKMLIMIMIKIIQSCNNITRSKEIQKRRN